MPINNFLFGLLVVGLYVVLINIKNIWLRPYILGRSVNMHEAIVFVAIIGSGHLYGYHRRIYHCAGAGFAWRNMALLACADLGCAAL